MCQRCCVVVSSVTSSSFARLVGEPLRSGVNFTREGVEEHLYGFCLFYYFPFDQAERAEIKRIWHIRQEWREVKRKKEKMESKNESYQRIAEWNLVPRPVFLVFYFILCVFFVVMSPILNRIRLATFHSINQKEHARADDQAPHWKACECKVKAKRMRTSRPASWCPREPSTVWLKQTTLCWILDEDPK